MREFLSDPQGYIDTVAMLRAVLDGETYQSVGRRYGVSRSTVERRIKGLVEHLLLSVGIEGLSLSSTAFIRRLRQFPEAVEQALAKGVLCGGSAQSVPLGCETLQFAIEHLRAESTRVAHDLALFYVLFTTGMRPLELTRLTVRDCLNEAGQVHSISELPARITLNGQASPLFLNPYGQAYSLICCEVQGVRHHRCRGMQRHCARCFGTPACRGSGFRVCG